MPRGLSTALQNEIANQSIRPIALVEIKFPTITRITNHYKDITLAEYWDDALGLWDDRLGNWDAGTTYEASGHLLKISAKTESSTLNVNNFSLKLSAVESTFTSTLLNFNVSNDEIAIDIGFMNSNEQLIDIFNYAKGFIDSFTIDTKTAVITLNCTSHFGDFSRVSGRKTNENSHGRFFPNDKESFEFSAEAIKDLKWGRI
tara:strand:- start:3574 stop:4179 length:606 start_codon:yes stop_codon:yes gene_type:complete